MTTGSDGLLEHLLVANITMDNVVVINTSRLSSVRNLISEYKRRKTGFFSFSFFSALNNYNLIGKGEREGGRGG